MRRATRRAVGRISSKNQVTLPSSVRAELKVGPGDAIVYEIERGRVRIRRAEPIDAAFHRALSETLDEWRSPEDDRAFRDL